MSFSPAKEITVRLDSDRTGIFIHVDDAGPGLPDGVEHKIFERFYTDRPNEHDLHSGLGLSISQQIARAHGGNVTARNRINAYGARFTLFLPHQGK
jgi:two-component system sensor histidine kinase ChvG